MEETPQQNQPVPPSSPDNFFSKYSTKYFVGGLVAIIGVVGLLLFAALSNTPKKSTEQQVISPSSVQPSQSAPLSPNTFTQEKIDEVTKTDGPWNRDLKITTGTDGKTFGESSIFVESAGVPSLAIDSKNRIVAVFQWFPKDKPESFDKVGVVFSSDNGKTWSSPQSVVVNGFPEDMQRPFDPTVVTTRDGKIRMFYTSNKNKSQENTAYYSAISEDGINYTFEKGARFSVAGVNIVDSAALIFNNTWHLTGPKMPPSGAYHATSSDGLTFTATSEIAGYGDTNWTGNLMQNGSEMRFYGGSGRNTKYIFYSSTADGSTWSTPSETNIIGGDPSVLKVSDGSYIMVYVGEAKDTSLPKNSPKQ